MTFLKAQFDFVGRLPSAGPWLGSRQSPQVHTRQGRQANRTRLLTRTEEGNHPRDWLLQEIHRQDTPSVLFFPDAALKTRNENSSGLIAQLPNLKEQVASLAAAVGRKLRKDVVGTCGLVHLGQPGHQRPHSGGRRRVVLPRAGGGGVPSPSFCAHTSAPPHSTGSCEDAHHRFCFSAIAPSPAGESTPQDRRLRDPLSKAHCSVFKPHLATSFCRHHVAAVVLTVCVWTSCRRLAVDWAFPPVLEPSPA